MPIATGNEYINPSQNNSVGAYIFPDGKIDPLEAQKSANNDVGAALDDAFAKQDAKKQAALANIDAMTKDIDFNKKGALEQDIPYFQQQQQNLLGTYRDLLMQNKGVSPDSPEYFQKVTYPIQTEVNKLKSEALISAGHKEAFGKDILEAASHPDKYDLEGVQGKIAALRTEPDLNKRDVMMRKMGYTTLTPGMKNWTDVVSARTKELSEHQLDETTSPATIGQQVGVKKTKGLSKERVANITNNDLMSSPGNQKSLNAAWDNMRQSDQQSYAEQLTEAKRVNGINTEFGKQISAWSPIQYFAYKSYRDQIPNKEEVSGLKFTPGEEAEAKAQTAEEKLYNRYSGLYDMVEGIVNEKPGMFDNHVSGSTPPQYNFMPGNEGELTSTQFKSFHIGSRPEQHIASYKADPNDKLKQIPASYSTHIVPDKIVSIMKRKGDQGTVYIKPESEILKAKSEKREPRWIPMPANTFAESVFSNNTIDEKGKPNEILGADALRYHANKRGQLNNGILDFTQKPTIGSTVKQPLTGQTKIPITEVGKETPSVLPTHSRKDLIDKGWTDPLIERAVKEGKFNVVN